MCCRIFSLLISGLAITGIAAGQPCCASLYYDPPGPALTDSCFAGTPLWDGTNVLIFWDVDSDGPDSTDPQPPVGTDSGDVNFNVFQINGDGYFSGFSFCSVAVPPNPPLFYLRICLMQRRWESSVINICQLSGLSWTCIESPCATQTTVEDHLPALLPEYGLDAPYPNPFNAETVIRFELPRPEKIRVAVFDVTGAEVMVLMNDEVTAGEHAVRFAGGNLSSGIYFVRMEAAGFRQTRKLVLLK